MQHQHLFPLEKKKENLSEKKKGDTQCHPIDILPFTSADHLGISLSKPVGDWVAIGQASC